MGNSLEQALAELIGREPTTDEITKFYKLKETLGLSEHDVVWTLLLAFGHYEILYGQIPNKIAVETKDLLAEHKIALEATAHATEKQLKTSLAESVSTTVKDISAKVIETSKQIAIAESGHKLKLFLSMSVGAICILVLLVGWTGFYIGSRAVDADTAWLNTTEGRAARNLAKINNVDAMMKCPKEFKQFTEGDSTYCIPYDNELKRNWGWRIK